MDSLVAFFLAAPLAFAPLRAQAPGAATEVWKATWNDLSRLAGAAPGSPERDRLWRALDGFQADRERAAHKASDRAEALRSRVLRYHLSRLGGVPPRPLAEPGSRIVFLPGEAWLALQALGPGPTRARATRDALAEARGEELATRADRVREAAEEDARDLHFDWALEEARALHEHAAVPRSAILLARVLRLRGEYDAAAKILEGALATASVRAELADLFSERAVVNAAAGADALAASNLGAALASGSREACLHLALGALSDGELARARSLFRSMAGRTDVKSTLPSALRGYGLALLARNGPNPVPVDQDPH